MWDNENICQMKNTPQSLFHQKQEQEKKKTPAGCQKNAEQSFICLQTDLAKEKNADIN